MIKDNASDSYIKDQFLYLEGLTARGIRTDLSQMRAGLVLLDNPERAVPTVIVGGTNGKGSVTTMIGNIVRHAEYSVGCYYSPHLFDVRERIMLNGIMISSVDMARLIQYIREKTEPDLNLTYFEFLTLSAYTFFARSKVDLGVMEVGMGGRYDATNVTDPIVSVVTTVSLDHTGYLGKREEEIAEEKAQIVGDGCVLVAGRVSESVREILRNHAREKGAGSFFLSEDFVGKAQSVKVRNGTTAMRYRGLGTHLDKVIVSLPGAHQIDNASVALATVEILGRRGFSISEDAIRKGLSSVHLPGRMERIAENPETIVDVAHNPAGARVLAEYIRLLPKKRTALVVGMMGDKDIGGFLRELDGLAVSIALAAPRVDRAASIADLKRAAVSLGTPVRSYGGVSAALEASRRLVGDQGRIVVTGSFYTVEEAAREIRGA